MQKKVAILQSNYIPWKGYFDLIAAVDEFILFDDMQYTRRDWRNRNKIKTSNGAKWLTIPVSVKGRYYQTIKETQVSDKDWPSKHWKNIKHHYNKAPYFNKYAERLEDLYMQCDEDYLSFINYKFITAISGWLNIKTKLSWSWDYGVIEGKTERLVDLCVKAEATEYISGPSAKDYIQPELFEQEGIKLSFIDYSNYPEYPQLYPPFEHGVSILDLLLNTEESANRYMKYV